MDKRAFVLRLLFAFLSFIVCAALAFRPIPSISASNDTGRYVASQEQACKSPISRDGGGFQQRAFDLLVRPTCWTGEPRAFLFLLSCALPVAILAFGRWKTDGALLLALGLLLSVIGFELSTDALRQAVSLAFLVAAISLENKFARVTALCAAVLLHESSWIFLPWVFLVDRKRGVSAKARAYAVLLATPLVGVACYYFEPSIATRITDGVALLGTYQAIYSTQVTTAFLIFMLLPTCWVFTVRWVSSTHPLPQSETITFWYSAVILAGTVAFFPLITYRVAMTAAVLQIFVAMRAAKLSVRSGAWIAAGLVGQLLVYAAVSPNVRAVLNV